jgi:hypothetical protein
MEAIGLEGVFDLSDFDKGIEGYLRGIKRTEDATAQAQGKYGQAFDSIGQGVTKAAGMLSGVLVGATVAAGAAVGAFVAGGITKAMDLEAQMGAIAAVMGETTEAVGPLKDLILDLGMDPALKVNANEAADALEKLASNGLTMTQIMDGAAKATVLLANATDADFDTAAAVATDTMALFNIEAENMMEAVNGITGVTVASKFDINDYRLALAQAGSTAANAGVEFDDFNTVITGSANAFASGSDAGTSFKTFLQRIIPSTSAAAEAMTEIGLTSINTQAALDYLQNKGITPVSGGMYDLYNQAAEVYFAANDLEIGSAQAAEQFSKWARETGLVQSAFYDASGSLKDMDVISSLLTESLSGLSEMERKAAVDTIFGADANRSANEIAKLGAVAYTDQATAAEALGVSFDSLTEVMEGGITNFEALQIQLGKTDAAESAKVRMDNLKGSMEILQGVIETVGLKIGFAFLPMLKEMADKISTFIADHSDQIVAFFEGFAAAIDRLVSGASWQEIFPGWLGGAIQTIADNMDILTGALGGIATLLAAAAIGPAFTAIGAAMATLLSPMVLLIGGAAALGAAWNTNFLGIKDATMAVIDPIANYIATVADAGIVSSEAREALTLFPEALQPIIGGFADTVAGIGLYTAAVLDAGVGSIEAKEALTVFPEALRGIAESSLNTVLGLWAYGGAIRDAGVFSLEAREALTLLPDSIEGIVGGFTETIGAIGNYVSTVVDAGSGSLEAKEALGLLNESFNNLVGAISEQLPIWEEQLRLWGNAAWEWIVESSGVALTKLGEWASSLVSALAAHLPTFIAGFIDFSTALVTWIGEAIPKGITALGEWAAALIRWIAGTGAKQVSGSTGGLVAALLDWVANDLIPKVGPAFWEWLKAMKTAVANIATSLGTAALAIADAIIDSILGEDWQTTGSSILTLLKAGWESVKSATLSSMGAIVSSLKDYFSEAAAGWSQVGKDLLDKIKTGIESAKAATFTTISSIVETMKERYTAPQGFNWATIGEDISNLVRDGLRAAANAAGGILTAVVVVATGIKDAFTDQSWDEVGQTIINFVRDGLKAAAEAAGGILETVGAMAQNLMTALTEVDWEGVGRTIAGLIKDGFKALAEGIGGLIPTASGVANDMGSAFTDIDWLALGKSIVTAIGTGLKAIAYGAGGVIYIVAEIVKGMTEEFFGVEWDTVGTDILTAIQTGITSAKDALIQKVTDITDGIKKVFTDLAQAWKDIGKGIVDGIGAGITGAKDALMEKAKGLANSLPGWVKEVLGISSPSKVFMAIGRDVVDGLIAGIESRSGALQRVVRIRLGGIGNRELLNMDISPIDAFTNILKDNFLPLIQEGTALWQQLEDVIWRRGFRQRGNDFIQAQIELMRQAIMLGADVSAMRIGDLTLENTRQMAILEEKVAEAYQIQLRLQAQRLKNEQKINDVIGQQLLNATAQGNIAQRFREQWVDPLLRLMHETGSTQWLQQFNEGAQRLLNLQGSQTRIEILEEQIGLLEEAARVGLNVEGIYRNIRSGGISSLLDAAQQVSIATEDALRNQLGMVVAMQQLQPIMDRIDTSSVFGQRYKQQVLDPILAALSKAAGIDSERVRLIEQYKVAAQELLRINQQEQQLDFLQQQLDIIRLIQDQDLVGGNTLFEGIAFGVNASIQDLLTLTSRVLNAMVEEVKDELGIHSPSAVFADIGHQMMTGLSQGIQRSMLQPLAALRSSTMAHGAVSNRVLNFAMGGVTINTAMDEVLFENRVLRVIERALN